MIIGGKEEELIPFVVITYTHIVRVYIYTYICTHTSFPFRPNIQALSGFN